MDRCPLRSEPELKMKPSASKRNERHKERDMKTGSLKGIE
jgi:hypothetical protein